MYKKLQVQQNNLLAAMPSELLMCLKPHLELKSLSLGQVLAESGGLMRYVYFPTNSIVSLLYVLENGASAEISVIGNDGVVGISQYMGGGSSLNRAVVQSAGQAYCMLSRRLKNEFDRNPVLQDLLLRYAQSLMAQMSQRAVCNRHHTIVQQLCRWLLGELDRLPNNEVKMTQEIISNMLGVRREGVTDAAGKLHQAGIIEYSRGRMRVLDRAKLQAMSCECYAVVKQEADRLLPLVQPCQMALELDSHQAEPWMYSAAR